MNAAMHTVIMAVLFSIIQIFEKPIIEPPASIQMIIIRLDEANLTGTLLYSANLMNARMRGALLDGANLIAARLSWTDMKKCKMYGSLLSRTELYRADLSGSDLSGSDFTRAYMMRSNLSGTRMDKADLAYADLTRVLLEFTEILGTNAINSLCLIRPHLGLMEHPCTRLFIRSLIASEYHQKLEMSLGKGY